jgi:hypothetical protein
MRVRIFEIGPGGEGAAALIAGQHRTTDVVIVFHLGKVAGCNAAKVTLYL